MSEDSLNEIRMKYYESALNKNKSVEKRIHDEPSRSRSDGPYQRDYTRIMYSSSFRRLQGKMQLLGIKPDQFFRNRLTHSLEVSQIARSIAKNLNCYSDVDMYVVEAAALAHDIGNPPFGHHGEKVLNDISKEFGGFEGNAQTLRILTNVEKKNPTFQGLNLTYRTLFSVIKYFRPHDKDRKKFIYEDDYLFLQKYVDDNGIYVRTLDAQVLDLADEIAYAAHDLEDGLRQKSFIIDEILHDFSRVYGKNSESYIKLETLIMEAKNKCLFGNGDIDSAEYSKLFRKELVSSIIHTLINDIELIDVSEEHKDKTNTKWDKELGFKSYANLSSGLKRLTFECINHNDDVYYYEAIGGKVIAGLFEIFIEKENFLPPEYRADNIIKRYSLDTNKEILKKRLIIDYISGMMDSYAMSTYKKFNGESSLDSLVQHKR